MDQRDSLIAEQALQIRNLELFKDRAIKDMTHINGLMVCIGGPLNDNALKYSHEQKQIFFKIGNITGDYL